MKKTVRNRFKEKYQDFSVGYGKFKILEMLHSQKELDLEKSGISKHYSEPTVSYPSVTAV